MRPAAETRPAPRGLRAIAARWAELFSAEVVDTEFMRESSAAVLQGPGRASHWILWATLVFFCVALAWAALAKIDQIVVGQGKVIPSSHLQLVQNLEGGIVSAILVQAGDLVQKDQVVMQLDATRFTSSYREGEAKDQTLQARIARLNAEAAGKPFQPPEALARSNPKVVAEEQAVYAARQRELEANLAVLSQQAAQKRQELAEMNSRERRLQESYALASKELALTQPLAAQGAVSEVELLRLQRQTNDLKGDLDASRLALPRLAAAVAEAEQKIGGVRAQARADASKDLSLARGDQTALSAANVGLEDRVSRTLVRAPMTGIVKQLKVNTVGGVIQPGVDLMEIVPIEDTVLIEAKVKPADIAFLSLGQEAMVKLSAYDYSIYGSFPATLEHISADTLTPEQQNEKAESFYLIRVRTKSNRLSGWDKPVNILPGMEATVDIRTDKRTVLHYLLKPIIKTKERALHEH